MLLGILSLTSTWIFSLIVLCGLGLSIQRVILSGNKYPDIFLSSFWNGLSVLIIFLQIWHLFAPVNMITLLIVILMSLVGIIINKSYISCMLTGLGNITTFILFFFVLSLWIAWQAMGPVINSDSGLYHIPSIKWISSYPIVPGLGNLHGRLAFNSSFFLLASLINTGFWQNKSHHVVNGLLFLVIFLQAGVSLWKMLFGRQPAQVADIMVVLLIPPLVILCKLFASSPTPDVPVFILGTVLSLQFSRMIYQASDYRIVFYQTFFLIIVSAIGFTIKVNFVIIGAVFLIIAMINFSTIAAPYGINKRRHFLFILFTLILVILPWMVRSVILSGYLVYPFPYLSFPVDWRIPFENALNEYLWIKSWARMPYLPPEQVLSNWHWLWPWIRELFVNRYALFMIIFPMGLTFLGLIILVIILKENLRGLISFGLFIAPPVISLFFWFWAAPDQRFTGIAFWYLGTGTLAVTSQYLKVPPRKVQLFIVTFTAIVLLLSLIFYRGSLRKIHTLSPTAYGFYPLPTVELQEIYTNSGLLVFIPKEGGLCWNAPIPCAPAVQQKLSVRKMGDMGSGFKISSEKEIQ